MIRLLLVLLQQQKITTTTITTTSPTSVSRHSINIFSHYIDLSINYYCYPILHIIILYLYM